MAVRLALVCLAAFALLAIVLAAPPQTALSRLIQTGLDEPNWSRYSVTYSRIYEGLGSVSTKEEVGKKLEELQEKTEVDRSSYSGTYSRIYEDLGSVSTKGAEMKLAELQEKTGVDRSKRKRSRVSEANERHKEKRALKELVSLSRDDSECEESLLVKFPIALQVAHLQRRKFVLEYLLEVGRDWFERCSQEVIENMKKPEGGMERKNFEQFFIKGLGLENVGQQEMLDTLKKVNLENFCERFNWEDLMPEDERIPNSSIGHIARYKLLHQYFMTKVVRNFNMVNMAAALRDEEDPFKGQIEWQILSEIIRIGKDIIRGGIKFEDTLDEFLKKRWELDAGMQTD